MEDSRILKDLPYGEPATGKRLTGRPQLRFKDICKHNLKALAPNTDNQEALGCDRRAWRQKMQKGLSSYEDTLMQQAEAKKSGQKVSAPHK